MNSVDNKNIIKQQLPTEEEIEREAQSGRNFFSKLFAISKPERKLFWVLCTLFFIISYVYSVIRDMKDALVIHRLDSGSIPYLKIVIVLPANIIAILIIQKMLSSRSISRVFSKVTLFFSVFFMVYGSVINFKLEPNEYIRIDPFSDGKMAVLGLEWTRAIFLMVFAYMTTLIYLFAELWGSCVLSFLFMSFTNSICTKKQNFRYTPLLLISSNIALLLSGFTMTIISDVKSKLSYEVNQYLNISIFVTLGILAASVFLIHRHYEKSVLLKQIFIPSDNSKKGAKLKVGIIEGLKEIFTSKLVLSMSFMVIAYSITVNMVENSFKSVMSIIAKNRGIPRDQFVMKTNGSNQIYTGFIVIFILLFKFSELVHIFGWISVAIMPPLFSLLSGIVYFTITYHNVKMDNNETTFFSSLFSKKDTLDNIELYVGQISVVLYKVLKYAAFDVCKEFISMTIDPLYRAHYKSIFDGICGKLGKAMGSGVTNIQNFFMNTTDVRKAALFSMAIVLTLDLVWIYAVFYLARKYNNSIKSNKYLEDERIFQ